MDAGRIASDIGFSDILHIHINRYLEAQTNGKPQEAVNAVDAFEDLMAAYYTDSYTDAMEGMNEDWEEIRQQVREEGYEGGNRKRRIVRQRFRALMRLTGTRGLLPERSPSNNDDL